MVSAIASKFSPVVPDVISVAALVVVVEVAIRATRFIMDVVHGKELPDAVDKDGNEVSGGRAEMVGELIADDGSLDDAIAEAEGDYE